MSDSGRASNKVIAHVSYICRLSANLIFILFLFGTLFTILGQSPENMKAWRINFSMQLMERSHLPFIGIALYALSLMSKEDRKYSPSVYWKYLTVICTLGIVLYLGSLVNSSLRSYFLMKQSKPSISLSENLEKMKSSVNTINSIDEAKSALRNASQRQGKEPYLEESDNLRTLKTKILEIESELIREQYEKLESQFYEVNRRSKFEALRYTIYSIIFIIFYLKLTLFFNRLQRSS
ncbi:MAG: hypothetical protein VXY33_05360 [Verrucomicrobiota bacterium]|nr:hypothetical protein [Verrucomicrobiota bacterium]